MQRVALAGQWGVGPARMIIVGGVCGLAWAAGLRGFMAVIAGRRRASSGRARSDGSLCQASLWAGCSAGRSTCARLGVDGAGVGWRWRCCCSPVSCSQHRERCWRTESGVERSRLRCLVWQRAMRCREEAQCGDAPSVVCALALAPAPIWVLSPVGDPLMAVTSPRGAWLAVYFFSFLAVLGLGCSIPHRPLPLPDGAPAVVVTREATRPATATPESRTVQPPV
jgi:hypothetical protein